MDLFRNGNQMNYNDLSSKLTQVIGQIPKDVLYDFCCSYAQEHEELAMIPSNELKMLREMVKLDSGNYLSRRTPSKHFWIQSLGS